MFAIGALPALLVFYLRRYVTEPEVAAATRAKQAHTGDRPPLWEIFSPSILKTTILAALMATAGTGISLVAFPWLALQHHSSARDASVVAATMTVPLVLSTLVAGAAVDFFGRRRVSLVSDSLSGTAVAAVPLIAVSFGADAINVAELAVLAFL